MSLEIDRNTNTTFWREAIDLEMKHAKDAFNILDEGQKPPPGYIFIYHHILFDVKMDLRRKACLVANGSTSQPTTYLTYASVVSRDSVRIMF